MTLKKLIQEDHAFICVLDHNKVFISEKETPIRCTRSIRHKARLAKPNHAFYIITIEGHPYKPQLVQEFNSEKLSRTQEIGFRNELITAFIQHFKL